MNKPKVVNDGVKITNIIADEKKKSNVEGTPKKLVLSKNAISFANPNAFNDKESYTEDRFSRDEVPDQSESYEPNFGGRPS